MNEVPANSPSVEDLLITIQGLISENERLKARLLPIHSNHAGRPRTNTITRPDYYNPKYGIWVSGVVDVMIDEYRVYAKSFKPTDFPAPRMFKSNVFKVSLQTLHLRTKFGLKYLFENDLKEEVTKPYIDYLEFSKCFFTKWKRDCISLEFTDLGIAESGALSNPITRVEKGSGKTSVGVVGEENLSWQEEVDRFIENTSDDIQIRLNNVNLSDEDVGELTAMFNGIKDGFNMIVKNIGKNEIFVIKSKKIYDILNAKGAQ